jgi:hypothetical protein
MSEKVCQLMRARSSAPAVVIRAVIELAPMLISKMLRHLEILF